MKNYSNLTRRGRLLLLMLFALLAGGVSPAWATELTVYNATSKSDVIPLQSYYTDKYQKCEFVMPLADISSMKDATITKMKFYTSTTVSSSTLGNSSFQVFLKEVANSTMTAFLGTEGATIVYTGTLSITSNILEINFTNGYKYNGGNLLIGVYLTGKNNWGSKVEFLGQGGYDQPTCYVGNNSSSLESVSGTAKYFLPKTTFTYEEAASEGPALEVTGATNGKLGFGIVDAGKTKNLTLTNSGSAPITLDITKTGKFGVSLGDNVSLTSVELAAGEENAKTLTITATAESTEGTVTITPNPEVDGISPITIDLSCIIKGDKKFVNFSEGLPEGWTKGSWTLSTTGGNNGGGYAANTSMGYSRIYSNYMSFADSESLIFAAKRGKSEYAEIQVQYSTDGSTWTTAKTLSATDLAEEDWSYYTINFSDDIPAGNYYIGFYGRYNVSITDIYGGQDLAGAYFAINTDGSTQNFGSVRFGATAEKTFTVTNSGNADLSISFASSGDFTVLNNFDASGKTLKLTDNFNWGLAYVYAWDKDGNPLLGEWPGTRAETVINGYAETQFVLPIPDGAVGLIFNNGKGGAQTEDITDFGYEGYWMDGTQDDLGHYKVTGYDPIPITLTVNAGGSKNFTVSMNTASSGDKSGNVKLYFDALNATSFTIPCTGNVKDANYLYVDFENEQFPEGWQVGTDWSIATASGNKYAVQSNTKTASALVTTPLTVAENETLKFKACRNASAQGNVTSLKVRYSTNGGVTWSEYTNFSVETSALTEQTLSGVPKGTVILEFFGSNIKLDDIEGFTKTTKPALAVTEGTAVVANGDTKDFGYLNANGTATYTVKNIGNATLNATISGEGVIVSPANISVAAGETADVTVTLAYGEPYGAKTGSITINSEDWVGAFVVNFTAELIDQTDFVEDFEGGKPDGWYSEWNYGQENGNGVAYIYTGNNKALITKKVYAENGKNELKFKAKTYSGETGTLTVYTTYDPEMIDRNKWNEPAVVP